MDCDGRALQPPPGHIPLPPPGKTQLEATGQNGL
jgi:hypothetical protein